MAAPTLVASYGNAAASAGTKTASVTVQAGDLVLVKAGTENAPITMNTPSGGGLTYTVVQKVEQVTNQSNAYVWASTSTTAQTFTLTLSTTTSSGQWTFVAEVWRNHNGVGASGKKTATSTTSLSLTTTGANSAISLLDADYNSSSGTRTYVTTAGAFVENGYQHGSDMSLFSGTYGDVGAAGAKSVGMSAPTGQRPSLVAVEVLAAVATGVTGSYGITAVAQSTQTPPNVQITVTDTRSSGALTSVTVTRRNPDGTTAVVRTSDGNPLPLTGGAGTVFDYEMPYNSPVSYSTVEVPTMSASQVTVTSSVTWLVNVGVPSKSVTVSFRPGTLQQEEYAVRQGVFYPMGRTNPVIVNDGTVKSPTSQLILSTESLADLRALRALISSGGVLLLNIPTDATYGFDACYIAVSAAKVSRLTDVVIDPYRDTPLSFYIVDRPGGGTQASRTFADIIADFGTFGELPTAYRSFADLLAGP